MVLWAQHEPGAKARTPALISTSMDDLCRPALQPGERKTKCVLALVDSMMAEIVGGKQGQA
jgi:hypothetical protein